MASSGNFVNDIIERHFMKDTNTKTSIRLSMIATGVIGVLAVMLALQFTNVLNAILYAYSFMVSGLFVPTVGAYFWDKSSSTGAMVGMISGGTLSLLLLTDVLSLPEFLAVIGLDVTIYGIALSAITFISVSLFVPDNKY
jgi:SSS family solute:Na+ symporter